LQLQPEVPVTPTTAPPDEFGIGPVEKDLFRTLRLDVDTWHRSVFWAAVARVGAAPLTMGEAMSLFHDPTVFWTDLKTSIQREASAIRAAMMAAVDKSSQEVFCRAAAETLPAVPLGDGNLPLKLTLASPDMVRANTLKPGGVLKSRCATPGVPFFLKDHWLTLRHHMHGSSGGGTDSLEKRFDQCMRAWMQGGNQDGLLLEAQRRWPASAARLPELVALWLFAEKAAIIARRNDGCLWSPGEPWGVLEAKAVEVCTRLGLARESLFVAADWKEEDAARVAEAYPDAGLQWSVHMAIAATACWGCQASSVVLDVVAFRAEMARHRHFVVPLHKFRDCAAAAGLAIDEATLIAAYTKTSKWWSAKCFE